MTEPPEDRATDRPEVVTAPATPREPAEPSPARGRRIPSHLGRARTSTVILSVLFLAIGFLYLTVRPDPVQTAQTGGGSDVQQPAAPTTTVPPTTTPPTTEPAEPTTTEPTPPEPTTTDPTGTTTPEEPSDITTPPAPTSEPPVPPDGHPPGGLRVRTSLTVAARFCGPPGTANGGYLGGRLSASVDAGTVSVRLRRPTPLDRPLEVRTTDAGAELYDGAELLVSAIPAELELTVPLPPSAREAAAAQAALPPRTGHPFPECFGCGPARVPGDAVAVFVGPLPDRPEVWAGIFRPTAQLPSSGGAAAPETVWAALDCPSFQPIAPLDPSPHLLGTITVRQDSPVRLDADHVVLAWMLGREGRRSTTASALIGPDGEVCARAQATWFAVPASTWS